MDRLDRCGFNSNSYISQLQAIAGPIYSYKQYGEAKWKIGRQFTNKYRLIARAKQKWFRHCRLAKKHLTLIQKNLKITNSPFALQHLIYIDLDTKKGIGTATDVLKLNNFVKDNYFPQLSAPLINERGGGNWLVVDAWTRLRPGYIKRVDAEEWNTTLKAFGQALQKLARHLCLTFSEIDAYGSLPVYVRQGQEVVDVRTDNKLLFKCPPAQENITQTISFARLKEVIASIEIFVATSPIAQIVSASTKVKSPGSSFEDAEDKIVGIYKAVMIDNTRPTQVVCGKKKRIINARKLSEYIYALSCLRKNADGSMPHRRVGAFISMMYQRGVFNHGYDPSVLTAVRNWLSSKGMIVWEDNTYTKGRACKWEMSSSLRKYVKGNRLSLSYFVSTTYSKDFVKPKYREEKPIVEGWQEFVESMDWVECGF